MQRSEFHVSLTGTRALERAKSNQINVASRHGTRGFYLRLCDFVALWLAALRARAGLSVSTSWKLLSLGNSRGPGCIATIAGTNRRFS